MSSEKIKVEIEICSNCKSHQWCTRHKEENYSALAIDIKRLIENKDSSIDVEIFQVGGTAMGSFEIICKETVLFSKLKLGFFPHIPSAVTRVIEFIEDFRNGRDLKKYSEARSISPHKTMISSASNGFKEKSLSTSSPKITVKRVKYDPNSQPTKKEEKNNSKDEKLANLHNEDNHEEKKEENSKKKKTETKQSEKEIPTQNREIPKEVQKEGHKIIPNHSENEIKNETDSNKDSSKHTPAKQNNETKPEELVEANFILKEEEKQEPQPKPESQQSNEEKVIEAPKNETNAQNPLNEIISTEKQEETPESKILTENQDKKIE